MSLTSQLISFERGDNRNPRITVKDGDGNAVNITGSSIIFSVKDNINQEVADNDYKFQRKNTAAGGSNDEIEITDGAGGVFVIKIIPANTQSMTPGDFNWDAELTDSSGDVHTVAKGILTLGEDVTRP